MKKSRICVAFIRRTMYSIFQFAQRSNYICIYRKLGNANITRTYIDTDSHKLKQLKVKIVIIICQTSNQSATMEQNYCSSKSIF